MLNTEFNRTTTVYSFFSYKGSTTVNEQELIQYLDKSGFFDRNDTASFQLRKMEYDGDLKRHTFYDDRPTLIELK